MSIGAAVNVSATDVPAPATPPDPAAPAPPKPETRVVVVGDSDFLANQTIGFEGNRDIGLNIANWLAQQENLIAIRPKEPSDRRITMTPDHGQAIFWLTLFVVPGLLFLTAFRVWWKRR